MTQHAVNLYCGLVLLHNSNGYQMADTYGAHALCVSMRGKYLHVTPYNDPLSGSCYSHFTNEQTGLGRLTTAAPITQPVRDKISLVTESIQAHSLCVRQGVGGRRSTEITMAEPHASPKMPNRTLSYCGTFENLSSPLILIWQGSRVLCFNSQKYILKSSCAHAYIQARTHTHRLTRTHKHGPRHVATGNDFLPN